MTSALSTADLLATPPAQSSRRGHEAALRTSATHRRVAIIGAGFGGLGMAVRLLQRGERDFVVLEKGSEVGGTWRDNTYPGCQCDVASNMYSFSFAPNPNWSRTYATQPEILEYLKGVADRFGARPFIRFDTEVRAARWDERAQHWVVETNRGTFTADVLVSGHGGLSAPSTPDVPGIERFRGAVFHSAAWNHEHSLAGERVAVIGTGASAIQIVPNIQPVVKELIVFQRTAPWVVPRLDAPFSAAKRSAFRFFPFLQKLDRLRLYLFRELLVLGMRGDERVLGAMKKVGTMHLEAQVTDPVLREKLRPKFEIGCKRVLISNDYYPALAASNAKLVTEGIREVTETGIFTKDGTFHEVDSIVLATGFKVTNHPIMERFFGKDGRSLTEHWGETMSAYLGTTVPGFPNFFLLTGPNTGLGHNSIVYMLESQFEYVLGALDALRDRRAGSLDVKPEAVRAFDAEMQERLQGTVWNSGCASWYLDAKGRNTTVWPSFTWEFRKRTRHFDEGAYTFAPRFDPVSAPAHATA
ncbi:MAG TPA: NAD(P)/FAD-dependent oxidoreductase [Polyangiaceae bacterium]|nr:NAD(P)/FAD-dependent oxidoreductase [Polyangiaceae bacterium]